MEHEELGHWLRLTLAQGVGNEGARRLLAAFGPPESVFAQSAAALAQVASPAQVQGLLAKPPEWRALVETTWRWLNETSGGAPRAERRVIALGDPQYPHSLLQTEDPPLVLYVTGQLDAWGRYIRAASPHGIAMVGSRNPTPQGQTTAREFARLCSEAGWTIVSGLALGVDSASHHGALAGAAARPDELATIAIVGTGLDRVYPRANLALAHRIAQQGVIISEYPLGTPPLSHNFPKRNRLIAGLSHGTLVVEAALKSGSLITARFALEQGKEVFAVPGSIHSLQSRGCHALIKQGAKLVESVQDVFDELGPRDMRPARQLFDDAADTADEELQGAPEEDPVLDQIAFDPVGLDALSARTGMGTAHLQVRLLELELDGHIARLPGGLFQRVASSSA